MPPYASFSAPFKIVTLCLLLLLGSLQAASAVEGEAANPFLPDRVENQGWPFIRGSGFDGHSKELHIAEYWPDSGPPVLWIRELGQGYSAFVAEGDRVYTQAQSLAGQFVYCLDANTGETLWRYRYGAPYELVGVYPGPRATPTVCDSRLYFAAPNGLIGCLTSDTGRLVWSKNVVTEYGGRGGVGFGYSCSPTVIDEMVILPVGGENASLVALDAQDGTEVWSSGSEPGSYTPAYPIEFEGQRLVLGYLKNKLLLCDRGTGELLANTYLSHGYDEHAAWPIYQEPYLWLSGPFQAGSQLLKLTKQSDGIEMVPIWGRQILSNDVVSSVLVDGYIYGFDIFDPQSKSHRPSRGKFSCIDMLTGEVQWSRGSGRRRRYPRANDETEPDVGQAGIIAVDGKFILLDEVGDLILLRATPERYEELARASVLKGQLTWTPPSLHRGRVYMRNHSRAVCVYVGEPHLLQGAETILTLADVPQSEYLDMATTILAIEPEYAFDVPSKRWLWNWYLASIAILICSSLVGYFIAGKFRQRSQRMQSRFSWLLAFVAGALGTTMLSRWTGDFIFTWPVCLYVAIEMTTDVKYTRNLKHARRIQTLWGRIPLLLFIAVCISYFFLCRRLSLLFQWTFLAGFIGALPLLWIRARMPEKSFRNTLFRTLLTLVSFTCFYAVGVVLLIVKYD